MSILIRTVNGQLERLLRTGSRRQLQVNINFRNLMLFPREDKERFPFVSIIKPNGTPTRKNVIAISNSTDQPILGAFDGLANKLHLETIELSASYYSKFTSTILQQNVHSSSAVITSKLKPVVDIYIDLPSKCIETLIDEPLRDRNQGQKVYINPLPILKEISDPERPDSSPIEEAPNGVTIKKEAHRMLRIRKRKMKVHRRKRLWKRMWSVWKKKFFNREKRREIEFRQKLIDKVHAAEKFNAEVYVNDYLEDLKYTLVPKTYKGRRKPQWLIQELMERDVQVTRREVLNNTNMLTNEPLIRKGETVENFVDRTWK